MKCAKCGFEAPEGAKFCRRCGSALERPVAHASLPGAEEAGAVAGVLLRCPTCGADLAPGENFCGECGAKLELADAAPLHPRGATLQYDPGAGQSRRLGTRYVLGAAALVVIGIAVALTALRKENGEKKPLITKESAASLVPKVLARVRGNAYHVDSTADGHAVSVQAIGRDTGIFLFNTETGAQVARCAEGGPYSISGSGRVIAVLVNNGIELCDPLPPSNLGSLQPGPAGFTSVALSPNGRLLASGRADGVVQLWDVSTRQLLWTSSLQQSSTEAQKVAVTDDRQVAALYLNPNIVWHWNESTGASREFDLRTSGNTAQYIRMLSFVTEDKVLASIGDTSWLLDLSTKQSGIRSFSRRGDALAPDGRTVISVGDYVGLGPQGYTPLTVWDLNTGDEITTLNCPCGVVASAAFTRNGAALLASTISGEILVWPLQQLPPQASVGESTPAPPQATAGEGERSAPSATNQKANQFNAVESLYSINRAEATYASNYGTGFSQDLMSLDGTGSPSTATSAGLIDRELANGNKQGYRFTYKPEARDASGRIDEYSVVARPLAYGTTGRTSFFIDKSHFIRWTDENRDATVNDPRLPGY
jgi:Double zinc ribbon/WD domain, G-beta repeat